MDELKNSVEKIAFEMLSKNQPDLIKLITEAVDKGESVKKISRFAEKRGSPLVAGLIEQAALYIKHNRAALAKVKGA